MYERNVFKKSVVQRVGWGPSLNLEQEEENFQNVLLPFPMFAFSLHLSLIVTSIILPVIFESIMIGALVK